MTTVLVADDERSIRLTMAAFLEAAEYHVLSAADTAEALEATGEADLQIALIDILLGEDNGLGLARHLREQSTSLQIVLMTGEPDVISAREAIRMDAFDYLSKPVSKEALPDVVGRAAQEYRRRQEYERLQREQERRRQALEEAVRERTAELATSERQKRLILDSMSEVVSYLTPDLRIVWANRAAAASVGKTPTELAGRHCHQVWHQRGTPCDGCPLTACRETGAPHVAEIDSPDGRTWLVRGYPVLDEDGDLEALVEFVQDVTARRQAQRREAQTREELEASKALLDQAESIARMGSFRWDLRDDSLVRQHPRRDRPVRVRRRGGRRARPSAGAYVRGAVGSGQRCRHGAGGSGARLRAVFHDQAGRRGSGAGPVLGRGCCQKPRRGDPHRQRNGRGNNREDSAPGGATAAVRVWLLQCRPTSLVRLPAVIRPGLTAMVALTVCLVHCAHPLAAQNAREATPVIQAGCGVECPPFCIGHEDGRADGCSVKLMQAALQAVGREATFRTGAWAEVKGLLERGDIGALSLVGRTPERETLFDVTVPYVTMHGPSWSANRPPAPRAWRICAVNAWR